MYISSKKRYFVLGGLVLLLMAGCLLLLLSGESVYDISLFIPIIVNAVWWWVQRPMLNRKAVYGVNLGLIAVGVLGVIFFPSEWGYLCFGSFELAFFAFICAILMLGAEGVNMPECRRLAIEAALPAREVAGACCSCPLSAGLVVGGIRERMDGSPGDAPGSVAGNYEDAERDWDCYVRPISDADWLLHVWTCDTFYLRDREIAAICEQHAVPLDGVLMGTKTNAFCLCLAGQLHIYPASAREDVSLFLSRITESATAPCSGLEQGGVN